MKKVNKPEIKARQVVLQDQGLKVKKRLQDQVHGTMHCELQDMQVEQQGCEGENQIYRCSLPPGKNIKK